MLNFGSAPNIEIFLTKDEVNNIGKLSYLIEEKISNLLNKKCNILNNLKLGDILNFSIFQTFFVEKWVLLLLGMKEIIKGL